MNPRGTYRKALVETTTYHCRPRERGATSRIIKHGLYFHPLAAPTFENRLRMRNDSSSQTSR
jgi:hypothetical protein